MVKRLTKEEWAERLRIRLQSKQRPSCFKNAKIRIPALKYEFSLNLYCAHGELHEVNCPNCEHDIFQSGVCACCLSSLLKCEKCKFVIEYNRLTGTLRKISDSNENILFEQNDHL